jgi:hypothetical protein
MKYTIGKYYRVVQGGETHMDPSLIGMIVIRGIANFRAAWDTEFASSTCSFGFLDDDVLEELSDEEVLIYKMSL